MLEKDVFPKLAKMGRLRGFPFAGQWFDIGTIERYKLAEKQWKGVVPMEERDEEMSNLIKEMMFTFEDIAKLDKNAITEILKAIEKPDLMLGLKSAPEDLKQKFFNVMSERARESFEEEMQFLGAVKMKEVEGAQRKIVEVVNGLAERGLIQLGSSSEEMVG